MWPWCKHSKPKQYELEQFRCKMNALQLNGNNKKMQLHVVGMCMCTFWIHFQNQQMCICILNVSARLLVCVWVCIGALSLKALLCLSTIWSCYLIACNVPTPWCEQTYIYLVHLCNIINECRLRLFVIF